MTSLLLKGRRRAPGATRAPARHPETARTLLALAVATLALLAAVVAAVGPASGESAEYVWPPARAPVARPDRGFYAPLPLRNRVPASLEVLIPCDLAPTLRRADPVTVLATARRADTAGALRILMGDEKLGISVGGSEKARVSWPESCPLRVEVADGELRIGRRTVPLETGTLENMPIVTGLFTGLDLRIGQPPRVAIRTRDYATSWTVRQVAAGALAVALIGVALILAARPRRRRGLFARVRSACRSFWGARDATDAVVAAFLLVWWIIAPTIYDDGAIWVELRAFGDLGGSAFYYVGWGLQYPLGEWIEWLRHWEAAATSDLVLMRVPVTVALFVGWMLCRWCVSRVVPAPLTAAVRWSLAGAFLVGATAWGMTLRLEPFISVLALASLAGAISFVRTPRALPLAVATLAAVLAATAHPTGLVASAPLIAATPAIVRWIRSGGVARTSELATVLLAGLALGLVVFAVDADLRTRLFDAHAANTGTHAVPWWHEYLRYARFDVYGGETAVRRLSLALILLPVLAWLTRRRAVRTGVLSAPAAGVAGALVLLAFVPSKWPWHFGAVASMGAVAVAAEVARMHRERGRARLSSLRPILALELVGVVAIWSWTAHGPWGPLLDLQEASWSDVFNAYSLLALLAVCSFAVVLSLRVGGVGRGSPGASVGWVIAIVSIGAVGLTSANLIRDAAGTAWSPARQNVEALTGHRGCGLASELRHRSAQVELLHHRKTPVFLDPPAALYFPCTTIPSLGDGLVTIPRLIVFPASSGITENGLTVPSLMKDEDGTFAAVTDLYRLTKVADGPGGVEVLSVAGAVPGFIRVDAERIDNSRAAK